jgi:hypothetical protein
MAEAWSGWNTGHERGRREGVKNDVQKAQPLYSPCIGIIDQPVVTDLHDEFAQTRLGPGVNAAKSRQNAENRQNPARTGLGGRVLRYRP